MKYLLLILAFLLCITAGAKAQTGEIGLEQVWNKGWGDYGAGFTYAVFSNDGQFIYSYGNNHDSTLVKIEANTGELIHRYDNIIEDDDVRSQLGYMERMMITPDNRYVVTLSKNGVIYIWNNQDYSLKTYKLGTCYCYDMEISPNSRYVYIGKNVVGQTHNSNYSEILIYDIELDEVVGKIEGLEENEILEIRQMELSGSGDSLFIASNSFGLENDDRMENRFAMININTRSVEKLINEYPQSISLKISDSGNLICYQIVLDSMRIYRIENLDKFFFAHSSGRILLINDSTYAFFRGYINGEEVNRVEIWQNNELKSYYDGIIYKREADSYEDENGFKICIAQGGSLKLFNSVITGVEDETELGINIDYSDGQIKVVSENISPNLIQYLILDIQGKIVGNGKIEFSNESIIPIDLLNGTYFLLLEIDDRRISHKFQVVD